MVSVCIFGSTARNRADSLSDRDILVVAPSNRDLTTVSRRWSDGGWSVAMLTHQQISNIAGRGLLFLQHLKQEAILIEDSDSFLGSLMDGYRPKQNYQNEIVDSMELLRDLLGRPLGYWPALCSADIAYVAVRNIAIVKLAEKGEYIFDYSDLINYLGSQCEISEEKREALRQLRFLKHSYRKRSMPPSPWRILEKSLEAAQELFLIDARSNSSIGTQSSGYRGLRLLELELVKRMDPRYLDSLPSSDPLGVAWASIRDPRAYPDPKPRNLSWLSAVRELAEQRRLV